MIGETLDREVFHPLMFKTAGRWLDYKSVLVRLTVVFKLSADYVSCLHWDTPRDKTIPYVPSFIIVRHSAWQGLKRQDYEYGHHVFLTKPWLIMEKLKTFTYLF